MAASSSPGRTPASASAAPRATPAARPSRPRCSALTARRSETNCWSIRRCRAPRTFSIDKLQTFTVSQTSNLVYGIDPETLTVGEDWVVRYVMVARSASGAQNVFYEGIRCQSAEVKTYARWDNNRSAWNTPSNAEWKPLSLGGATRPATILAMEGLCNGKSVNGNPRKMLATLKTGMYLQR
ncbi:MAG: hypothetical protein EOP39_23945 [Rubrivivax sp.]|nr:MAG: hypothetical protein EOP39_23945 [Rubrivivax sp.]